MVEAEERLWLRTALDMIQRNGGTSYDFLWHEEWRTFSNDGH